MLIDVCGTRPKIKKEIKAIDMKYSLKKTHNFLRLFSHFELKLFPKTEAHRGTDASSFKIKITIIDVMNFFFQFFFYCSTKKIVGKRTNAKPENQCR